MAAETFTAFGKSFASEREAIISLLDGIQVAESCAGGALKAWAETSANPALKGGLRMIAEREAYHGRVFAERIRELGGECRATLDAFSRETEACIRDTTLTDLEKLTRLVERNGDPETLLRPILEFADNLTEDPETRELLRLFHADEMSSGTWFRTMRRTLAEEAMPQAA